MQNQNSNSGKSRVIPLPPKSGITKVFSDTTVLYDREFNFKSYFDADSGVYLRTNILDDAGHATSEDSFMSSYPQLLDIGIMGH